MTTVEMAREVMNTPENILLGAKGRFSEAMYSCPLFRCIAEGRIVNKYSASLLATSVCTYEPYVSEYNGRTFIGVEAVMDDYRGGLTRYRIRFAETTAGVMVESQALRGNIAKIVKDDPTEVVDANATLLFETWNTAYGALCDELGGDFDTINEHFCLNKAGLFEVRTQVGNGAGAQNESGTI